MISKEAVKLARLEFEKDFDDGEETNQWLVNVIEGLKLAERDLDILETLKNALVVERMPPKPFDPNEEFNFDSYIHYIVKYNTYIFDKNIREKFTQWIIDNIDKETVRKWLKNGSD